MKVFFEDPVLRVVLFDLVAGPALLVMGLITGVKAGKNLETARINAA